MEKMVKALKPEGYMYTSFKYGEFEGYRNGRYFTDFTENTFSDFITDFSDVRIIDKWLYAEKCHELCQGMKAGHDNITV